MDYFLLQFSNKLLKYIHILSKPWSIIMALPLSLLYTSINLLGLASVLFHLLHFFKFTTHGKELLYCASSNCRLRGKSLCLTNILYFFVCKIPLCHIHSKPMIYDINLFYCSTLLGAHSEEVSWKAVPVWDPLPGNSLFQGFIYSPLPGNAHSGDTHSSWPHAILRQILIILSSFWNK